jgi:hypothetical protein
MYKLETEPRYWWPVTVAQPDKDKPGTIVEQQLEAEFRWLDSQELKDWQDDVQARQLLDPDAVPLVCTGFRHVQLEDGTPMASTPENLALLLRGQGVATAFVKAFYTSRAKAAEKN